MEKNNLNLQTDEHYWVRVAGLTWPNDGWHIVRCDDSFGDLGLSVIGSDCSYGISLDSVLEAKWIPKPITSNENIDAEITVSFIGHNIIDEASLADWDGKGGAISLEGYVRFMLQEGHLADLTNDWADPKLVSIKRIR